MYCVVLILAACCGAGVLVFFILFFWSRVLGVNGRRVNECRGIIEGRSSKDGTMSSPVDNVGALSACVLCVCLRRVRV